MADPKEDYDAWEQQQKEERRRQAQEQLAEFHAQRQRELEARRQTREASQGYQDPLQLMSMMMQAAAAAPSAASAASSAPTPAPVGAVRVREVGESSFRKVLLPGGSMCHSFSELETLVSAKFASKRGLDGQEMGPRPLVFLIRLRDQLQICDDEDLVELKDQEELEATFASVTASGTEKKRCRLHVCLDPGRIAARLLQCGHSGRADTRFDTVNQRLAVGCGHTAQIQDMGAENLAQTFVFSNLRVQYWGEHMSEYQSVASIMISFVAVIFGGPFGRFSDAVDRRAGGPRGVVEGSRGVYDAHGIGHRHVGVVLARHLPGVEGRRMVSVFPLGTAPRLFTLANRRASNGGQMSKEAFEDFLASFMTYSAETNKKIVQEAMKGPGRRAYEAVRRAYRPSPDVVEKIFASYGRGPKGAQIAAEIMAPYGRGPLGQKVANEAYRSIRRSHTGRGVLQDMVEWQAKREYADELLLKIQARVPIIEAGGLVKRVWTTPIPPHLKKLVEDAVVQAYKEQTKQLTAANPVVKAII
ncbi:unnamed protein product [Durusdinium trenchii]|uniref:Ubiquitin-like domain-containing protein n=1 Tax=Durusdinium trenchii TaxID=1381693 RepID=A0ABP0LI78_9DINO